jgi:hypothetical protein
MLRRNFTRREAAQGEGVNVNVRSGYGYDPARFRFHQTTGMSHQALEFEAAPANNANAFVGFFQRTVGEHLPCFGKYYGKPFDEMPGAYRDEVHLALQYIRSIEGDPGAIGDGEREQDLLKDLVKDLKRVYPGSDPKRDAYDIYIGQQEPREQQPPEAYQFGVHLAVQYKSSINRDRGAIGDGERERGLLEGLFEYLEQKYPDYNPREDADKIYREQRARNREQRARNREQRARRVNPYDHIMSASRSSELAENSSMSLSTDYGPYHHRIPPSFEDSAAVVSEYLYPGQVPWSGAQGHQQWGITQGEWSAPGAVQHPRSDGWQPAHNQAIPYSLAMQFQEQSAPFGPLPPSFADQLYPMHGFSHDYTMSSHLPPGQGYIGESSGRPHLAPASPYDVPSSYNPAMQGFSQAFLSDDPLAPIHERERRVQVTGDEPAPRTEPYRRQDTPHPNPRNRNRPLPS